MSTSGINPADSGISALGINPRLVSSSSSGANGDTQTVTNPDTGDSISYNSATQTQYSGTQASYTATINGLTTSTYQNGAVKETGRNGNSLVSENGVLYGADSQGNRTELGSVNDPNAWTQARKQGFASARGEDNLVEAMAGGLGNVDGVKSEFPNAGQHIGPSSVSGSATASSGSTSSGAAGTGTGWNLSSPGSLATSSNGSSILGNFAQTSASASNPTSVENADLAENVNELGQLEEKIGEAKQKGDTASVDRLSQAAQLMSSTISSNLQQAGGDTQDLSTDINYYAQVEQSKGMAVAGNGSSSLLAQGDQAASMLANNIVGYLSQANLGQTTT